MTRALRLKLLKNWWERIRTSLWFVPTVLIVTAVAIALIMPEIDRGLEDDDLSVPPWIFGGSVDGAHTLLSTVAGSLITIVGVLFSITIVVLQQAASQFTPRVMGNFIRQTGTQLTLGIYLATFLYALLILRLVRGEDAQAEEFIPRFSIAFALVLATACLGFLVYFIHHMATSLQASAVLSNVNREFREDVGPLYPEHIGESAHDEDMSLEEFRRQYMRAPIYRIAAERSGYLMSVDDDAIVANASDTEAIAIIPQIGDFVVRGTTIIEVSETRELSDEQRHSIAECLELGSERSRFQDPLFSIRQLVDIALKALSTGVNDPTTATNAISMLGDSIALLAGRKFPERVRRVSRDEDDSREGVYVWTNRPPFSVYVDSAFSEIRREAMDNVSVAVDLAETIGAIGDSITVRERAEPLRQVLDDLQRGLPAAGFDERDERLIRERIEAARRELTVGQASGPGC